MSGSSRGSFRSVIPTSSVDEKFKYKYVSKYGMNDWFFLLVCSNFGCHHSFIQCLVFCFVCIFGVLSDRYNTYIFCFCFCICLY